MTHIRDFNFSINRNDIMSTLGKMSPETIKSLADFSEEAHSLIEKGELDPKDFGKWIREKLKAQRLAKEEKGRITVDASEFQDESVDETEEQSIEETVSEAPRKMNKMQILFAKSLTVIKQAIVFFNQNINITYLLGFSILVFLLIISQKLSDIKNELRTIVIIQKKVHTNQDMQIGRLSSEQQDFVLLSTTEQIEKWDNLSSSEKPEYFVLISLKGQIEVWNKMNPSEKPKYAKVFKDEMYHAEFQSIGMTSEEV